MLEKFLAYYLHSDIYKMPDFSKDIDIMNDYIEMVEKSIKINIKVQKDIINSLLKNI